MPQPLVIHRPVEQTERNSVIIKLDSSSSTHSWAATESEVHAAEQEIGICSWRDGKLSPLLKGLERKGVHFVAE